MSHPNDKRRRHNDLGPSPRLTATQRLAPFQGEDFELSLAYVKGMSDSGSFWLLVIMFCGGLFWGGVLTWWLS